jgi:Zn-finger protein
MSKKYDYFSHKECEFFPCHKGANPENFNCLFCYCPLYLVKDCGGAYTFTKEGIKDCSNCLFPHRRENYGAVIQKLMKEVKERHLAK